MRPIDAHKLSKLIKEFRNDRPQSTVRWSVCNTILSMLGDENRTPTIEAGPVRQAWISVEDRLPEKYKFVLLFGIYDRVWKPMLGWLGDFDEGWYVFTEYGEFHPREVSHWMPLPEAPKEETP